jgi:hypothetical protein
VLISLLKTMLWWGFFFETAAALMDFQGEECYIRGEDEPWPNALKQ